MLGDVFRKGLIMADKKGFGNKTSNTGNVYSLLGNSTMNVQDLQRKGGEYSGHWKKNKKDK
jgi:hypothetical protein